MDPFYVLLAISLHWYVCLYFRFVLSLTISGLGITLNEWINRKRLGIEEKLPRGCRAILFNFKKFLFTFSRFIDL
jgi:hypothetical protein